MAEGTPEHEPARATPERPNADLQLGLGRRVYDNQAMRHDSRRAGDGPAEVANSRFDRIEDRLDSLERMLRELITSRAEPRADGGCPSVRDEPAVVPAVPQVAAPVPAPLPAQAPAWDPASDDEELDQSVREYVERLLKRDEAVRVARRPEPAPAPPSPMAPPPAKPPASSSRFRADDEAAVAKPLAAAEPTTTSPPRVSPPEEFVETASPAANLPVRRPRPDHDVNLEAMRLVANLSATAAIRTYEKSQAARKTMDRLPLLLIGVVCGLMLLYAAWSSGTSAMLVGAGVAFVGAALTAWQLLFILYRWLAASRPVRDP